MRYKERSIRRFNKALLFVVIIGAILTLGFVLGREHAAIKLKTLEIEVTDKDARIKKLQDDMTATRAEAQTATSRFEQLKAQYEKELPPSGPIHDIVDMVRKQIDSGMPPERLAFILRSARAPSNCSDPATKRFIIKTPAYKGAESNISVGEGAVIVSGTGVSSRSKVGQLESWYDPTQLITVTFKKADGETEKKTGTLPFQYSLIAMGREYRFNFSEGEKSFVKVTFDSCEYQ